MKYLSLLKKYLMVFVGAFLFGLAAMKVKSAQRGENKAAQRVRDLTDEVITIKDNEVNAAIDDLKRHQDKAKEARDNAVKKLDTISDNSNSVKSLLDEYNRDRMRFGPNGN
jgi:hypothetical protein